ncbi:MAG: hypothetical protein R3F61_02750 [Myxococcota bacterium]
MSPDRVDPEIPPRGDVDVTGIYTNRTLFVFFAITVAICTAIVAGYAPVDWGWFRTVAAGGLLGGLAFLSLFVNHLIIPPLES